MSRPARAATASTATPTASSRLVRQAAELGADVIKADPTDDLGDYHRVVTAARVPAARPRRRPRRPTRRSSSARAPCSRRARAGSSTGATSSSTPTPPPWSRALMARRARRATPRRARTAHVSAVRVGIVGGGPDGPRAGGGHRALERAGGPPGRARARRRVRHEPRGAALVRPHRHRSPTRRPTAATCSRTTRSTSSTSRSPTTCTRSSTSTRSPPARTSWARSRSASTSPPPSGSSRPIEAAGVFVRCSSEMPFFPGAQLAYETIRRGALGQVIEVQHDFLHSSDLDRAKPINWKRQARYCGAIGVMGDLGMHVAHLPLRLGWQPGHRLRAAPGHRHRAPRPATGEPVPCDTIDNATLHCDAGFPLTLRTHRIAPGPHEHVAHHARLGMDGGVELLDRAAQDRAPLRAARRAPGLGAHRGRQPVGVRHRHRRRSSSSASPTRSCRCGPPTSPSARARSATASAAPRRARRSPRTACSTRRCAPGRPTAPSPFSLPAWPPQRRA